MALHTKAPRAVRLALKVYSALIGREERRASRDRQARDLITDILLMFDDETASRIVLGVERDYDVERSEVAPLFTDV